MNRLNSKSESFFRQWLLPAFVVLTCLRVWVGPTWETPPARAQIPDSGLQRKQMLDAVNQTNSLLADILNHLKTQPIKVRMADTDNQGDATTSPR